MNKMTELDEVLRVAQMITTLESDYKNLSYKNIGGVLHGSHSKFNERILVCKSTNSIICIIDDKPKKVNFYSEEDLKGLSQSIHNQELYFLFFWKIPELTCADLQESTLKKKIEIRALLGWDRFEYVLFNVGRMKGVHLLFQLQTSDLQSVDLLDYFESSELDKLFMDAFEMNDSESVEEHLFHGGKVVSLSEAEIQSLKKTLVPKILSINGETLR